MEYKATKEQQTVLDADLVPLKVEACAGSGKTATAVRRLVEVRRRMESSRGHAVLLSYSNVAVDTFRQQYAVEATKHPSLSERVTICTVDSFITNNILAPHGSKVMNCVCRPYLAHGRERFLENKVFSVFDGKRYLSLDEVDIRKGGDGSWEFVNKRTGAALPREDAIAAVVALGKAGAYTHSLGRFWALKTLIGVPRLDSILARKFPHILVDEAQDIGAPHGRLLSRLANAGSTLSLVGDANQAIFEFADADGSFLKGFKIPSHGVEQPITENRRSVSQIVDLANRLAIGAKTKAVRKPPEKKHGAYYLPYQPHKLNELVSLFGEILDSNKYARQEAVILARGKKLGFQLSGGSGSIGTGATRMFADAALYRDVRGDIATAFERTVDAFLRLVETNDSSLRMALIGGERTPGTRQFRNCIWRFLRDSSSGLPSAKLLASEWHKELKRRLPDAFAEFSVKCNLETRKSWVNNVTTKGIGIAPLFVDSGVEEMKKVRTSSVHKAKGESIAAVLYVTNARSLKSLIGGAVSEEGRIGYVAITRAADLLIVAIPKPTKSTIKSLMELGLVEWVM